MPAIDSTIGWPNLYTLHNIVGYPQILIQKNKKVPTYLLRATCSEPYPRLIDNRSLNDVCRPINLYAPITERRVGEQYTAVYEYTIYNILSVYILCIYNRHGQITIINNSYHV